jgi:hypothetical protein
MNKHVDFFQYYDPDNQDPKPADPAQAMADDIEAKLKKPEPRKRIPEVPTRTTSGNAMTDARVY